MKNNLRSFWLKLFSLILAFVLAFPAELFAAAIYPQESGKSRKAPASVGLMTRLDSSPDTTANDEETESRPIKSDISIDETEEYIVEKEAYLSKTSGEIFYRILVKAKKPDEDMDQVTSFAINPNTDLHDLKLDKVNEINSDGKEVEVAYTENTPGIFASKDEENTLGARVNKPSNDLVYYLSASLSDQALDEIENVSPVLSIDMAISTDTNKQANYQSRYALEIGHPEESEEIVVNPQALVLKEVTDDYYLVKANYNPASQTIFGTSLPTLTWTDYILAKDEQEISYDLSLDPSQNTENTIISVEFFEAKDNGYIKNTSLTQNIPYTNRLNIQIPQVSIAKLSLQTSINEEVNSKNFSFNGKTLANPAYEPAQADHQPEEVNEEAVEEEGEPADEDPLPAGDERLEEANQIEEDEAEISIQADPEPAPAEGFKPGQVEDSDLTPVEDSEPTPAQDAKANQAEEPSSLQRSPYNVEVSEGAVLEISDQEQNAQQAAAPSQYKTSYPYSIEYDVKTSVRDGNGNPITSLIPSAGQNPEVWWDITLDTSKVKDPTLNYDNLYYTLYMGAKDGLDEFKYKVSTSPINDNDTSGFDTADTRSEFLYQGYDNIPKKKLGEKLYIMVKASIDDDSEVHDQYSLGIRINPDRNYMDNLLKEFLAKYEAIPTPLKWKVGDGKADIYRDRPFNLLDERIVASPNFIKYDIDDNFYFDSTRSITADRRSDTRVEWNVLDLLRFGESEDPSIDQAILNPDIDKSDRNKYYYRPNLTGGYNRYSGVEDVKTKEGEFYPGTIVAYNFEDQKGSPHTNYKLDLTLQKKENLFKVLLDNQMNGVNSLTDPVGGSVSAYTYKIPPAAIDDQYLAYNENPFAIMRINKTFEMVQCFNDGYEDPTSSGNDIIGLQRMEDPEARFLWSMMEGNNYTYAQENFKSGAKYNKQKVDSHVAFKDALERAYFYTNQVVEEQEKKDGKKIPRQVEAFLYQKMVHAITNNKPLDQQYGGYTSISDQVKNWTNIDTTLTGNESDKYFTGEKSKGNRTIPTDERKIKNNDKEALDEAERLAREAESRLNSSYKNNDWDKTKADSVELIFYKHNHNKTIQNLITAKIRKPINAQKINVDGTNLEGAEFTFTSRQTGESVNWTSQKDNTNNPLFLKPGQYYVDETKEPEGYSKLETFLIELKEVEVNPDHGPYPQHGLGDIRVNDGYKYELSILDKSTREKNPDAVQKDGSGNPLVTVDKDTLNLNIKNEDSKLGKIEFTKVNKSGRQLDGATFTLTKIKSEENQTVENNSNGKPVYQKTSTGNNGKFTFASIPAGTYKLEETVAPTGYQKIEPLILKATKDGDGKVTVTFNDEEIEDSKKIINQAPSTDLSFRKIREKGEGEESVPIDSGTGKFRLYSTSTTDDSDYDQIQSPAGDRVNEDGKTILEVGEFRFTGLVKGEYILVEEQAPVGFQKPDFPYWRVKVLEDEENPGELTYEVYKLENEPSGETRIDPSKILRGDDKEEGTTFDIENKARTINHKFKKLIENPDNTGEKYIPIDPTLRGADGEPVSFRLYEADYYGLKQDPNDPGKRIVADANGDFNLEGLEYSSYYLLEEENPPKGYSKAAATVIYVEAEAEIEKGQIAVVVRDRTANTLSDSRNIFRGIIDYKADDARGKLLVKKTGDSLVPRDNSEVGLRRAYFRLYYADKNFDYANDQFQKVTDKDKASYIERVSAGSALTDNEGNPLSTNDLPNDQGIVRFENLKPGNYILIEQRGPAGYEKDPNPRYIRVTDSGMVIKSMDKDDPSLREETNKAQSLFDVRNISLFSANRPASEDSLMVSDLPASVSAQRASQTSTDGWEKVADFRSDENHYRNQDPAGNDINNTQITEINKTAKRFRQVFIINNPKDQTLVVNLHRQPLSPINPTDFNIKLSYVDSGSSFDNLIKPKEITGLNSRNLDNNHIRLETRTNIPANTTLALEVEAPYKGYVGLGLDFFYDHPTADSRAWKKAWVAEMYESENMINFKDFTTIKTEIREEYTNYKTIKEDRSDIPKGTSVIHQPGIKGKTRITEEVTYTNGKEVSRKETKREVLIKQQDEIIYVGTKENFVIPKGDGQVKVNFLYNNMDDNDYVEEKAPDRNSGRLTLQVQNGKDWLDISDQIKDVPFEGTIQFEKLDPNSNYRLVYNRDQILAERWGLPRTSTYNIDFKEEKTFELDISNGNLLRVFNKDETGFRIPLRITKKDENGGPLSGAQFKAKKIIQGEDPNVKYFDEEFDAVSAATGLSGDNYFRELSPGIYELTETRSPKPKGVPEEESEYALPKDRYGKDQKWYFEVKKNPEVDNPRKANYMIIDFAFKHKFSKDDDFTKAGQDYNNDKWYGETIYGTQPVTEGGKVVNEDFMKLIKLVPDDHRSNPARPDAPYKGIDDLEVTNVKKTTNFDFIKADEYSRAIEGAKFRLRKLATDENGKIDKGFLSGEDKFAKDENGQDVYDQEVTSDTNEGVTFKDIPKGTYLLEETEAPAGYEKLEKPIIIKFEISPTTGRWEQTLVEDGDINKDYYNSIISYKSDNTGISQIKNTKAYTNLEFTKVDQSGDEVKAAAFTLEKLNDDGSVNESFTPQEIRNWNNPIFTFENLTKGKYKLTETNPTKYQRPNPTYFNVVANDKTGKLEIKFEEGDPNIKFVDKGNTKETQFINFDKVGFEFKKVGDDNKTPLYRAGFSLKKVITEKGENGKAIYDSNGNLVSELSDHEYSRRAYSGSDGKVSFQDLSQGVYELEETDIPYGYQRLNAQRKWIVIVEKNEKGDSLEVKYDKEYEKSYYKDDTSYNADDDNELTIDGKNNTLKNTSNTTELNFNKVDRAGTVIAKDTKFTLIKLSHDPNDLDNLSEIKTYINYINLREDDGTFNVKGLDRGIYVLSETRAPEGYKQADREIVLKLIEGADGKLVIKSYEKDKDNKPIKSGFKYVDNRDNKIEIANDEIPNIAFNKVTNSLIRDHKNIVNGTLEISISPYNDQTGADETQSRILSFDLSETKSINKIYIEDADGNKVLEDGKYIIKESKAPQGYVMANRSYLVDISTDDNDGKVTVKLLEVRDASGKAITNESGKVTDTGIQIPDDGLVITADKNGDSNFKIVNNNPSLPATGGSGVFKGFALLGTAVMLIALAYFGLSENKRSRFRR